MAACQKRVRFTFGSRHLQCSVIFRGLRATSPIISSLLSSPPKSVRRAKVQFVSLSLARNEAPTRPEHACEIVGERSRRGEPNTTTLNCQPCQAPRVSIRAGVAARRPPLVDPADEFGANASHGQTGGTSPAAARISLPCGMASGGRERLGQAYEFFAPRPPNEAFHGISADKYHSGGGRQSWVQHRDRLPDQTGSAVAIAEESAARPSPSRSARAASCLAAISKHRGVLSGRDQQASRRIRKRRGGNCGISPSRKLATGPSPDQPLHSPGDLSEPRVLAAQQNWIAIYLFGMPIFQALTNCDQTLC